MEHARKTLVYLVSSLRGHHTEYQSYLSLSCVVGQWFARPVRNWDDLPGRENNGKHFSIVLESKSSYSVFFLNWTLKDSLLQFPFKFLKSFSFTTTPTKPTHPSQVPRTSQQGNLWLTLAKVKLYNRIHSSLSNFFFATHVDSLEIVRRNLAKVIGFYCFLCKKIFFSSWQINCTLVPCNSTPISRVPTRKEALQNHSFGNHKNEETHWGGRGRKFS